MGAVLRMGSLTRRPHVSKWQYSATIQPRSCIPHFPTLSPTCWSLLFPLRKKDKLRGDKARAAALLAGKALLEQDLGRLTVANARLEGEKAAQQVRQAQADREREAWQQERAHLEGEKAALQAALGAQEEAGRRDRAQLEREKVALRAALGAQEAGRQDRAQLESQLQGARREHHEYKARVMAAVEL